MRIRTRTAVVGGVAAIALAGAAGTALAVGSGGEDDELSKPGTITVDEAQLPEDDAAEQDALAELATVTEEAATQAAVASVDGGESLAAELEDEDGFVVWEVDVRGADGAVHEVTVDAGDASVLGTEVDDEENEADEVEDDDADEADDADDESDDARDGATS